MNLGGLDGDRIVQVLGIVMVLALLSRSEAVRRLPVRKRLFYGLIWAGIFIVGALAATLIGR